MALRAVDIRGTAEHLEQPSQPVQDALNNSPKYVASATLHEPLPWPNSTLLRGDVDAAVGPLKVQSEGVLAIMGSGVLIGALSAADLIDEYLLMVHPLVLGSGTAALPRGSAGVRFGLRRASRRPPAW